MAVHDPKPKLSMYVALYRGATVPCHSSGVVLGDPLPLVVHEPKPGLSVGVALICGEPEPRRGLGVVLGKFLPSVVHESEVELCYGITLFRAITDSAAMLRRNHRI